MQGTIVVVILGICVVWLILLTLLFLKYKSHYDTLVKDVTSESLTSLLDRVLGDLQVTKKDIADLSSQYDRIEKEGSLHIQKIGLVRFNPFKDTGGDQSFILSLLDAHNNGIVISGLYSRSGMRWYAKQVADGKGAEHELSVEEVKAIQTARIVGKDNGK